MESKSMVFYGRKHAATDKRPMLLYVNVAAGNPPSVPPGSSGAGASIAAGAGALGGSASRSAGTDLEDADHPVHAVALALSAGAWASELSCRTRRTLSRSSETQLQQRSR